MMLLTFATLIAFTRGHRHDVRATLDLSTSVQTVEVAGHQFVAAGNKSKTSSFHASHAGICCCAEKEGEDMRAFDVPYDFAVGHTGLRGGTTNDSHCPWIGRWQSERPASRFFGPCACTIREDANLFHKAAHAFEYLINTTLGLATWEAPTTCKAEESVGSHSHESFDENFAKASKCNTLCDKDRTPISQACTSKIDEVENFKRRWDLDDQSIEALAKLDEKEQTFVMSSLILEGDVSGDIDMNSSWVLADDCYFELVENLIPELRIDFMRKLALVSSADERTTKTFLASLAAFVTFQDKKFQSMLAYDDDDQALKEFSKLSPKTRQKVMKGLIPTQKRGPEDMKRAFTVFLLIREFNLDKECQRILDNLSHTSQYHFMTTLAVDGSADEINKETFLTSLEEFNTVQRKIDEFKGTWFDEECGQVMDAESFMMQKYIIENFKPKENVEAERFKPAFITFVRTTNNVVKNRNEASKEHLGTSIELVAVANPGKDLEITDQEFGESLLTSCQGEVESCCYTKCGQLWCCGVVAQEVTCVLKCLGKEMNKKTLKLIKQMMELKDTKPKLTEWQEKVRKKDAWKGIEKAKPKQKLQEETPGEHELVQKANAIKKQEWIEPSFQPKKSKNEAIWATGNFKPSDLKKNKRNKRGESQV